DLENDVGAAAGPEGTTLGRGANQGTTRSPSDTSALSDRSTPADPAKAETSTPPRPSPLSSSRCERRRWRCHQVPGERTRPGRGEGNGSHPGEIGSGS